MDAEYGDGVQHPSYEISEREGCTTRSSNLAKKEIEDVEKKSATEIEVSYAEIRDSLTALVKYSSSTTQSCLLDLNFIAGDRDGA